MTAWARGSVPRWSSSPTGAADPAPQGVRVARTRTSTKTPVCGMGPHNPLLRGEEGRATRTNQTKPDQTKPLSLLWAGGWTPPPPHKTEGPLARPSGPQDSADLLAVDPLGRDSPGPPFPFRPGPRVQYKAVSQAQAWRTPPRTQQEACQRSSRDCTARCAWQTSWLQTQHGLSPR